MMMMGSWGVRRSGGDDDVGEMGVGSFFLLESYGSDATSDFRRYLLIRRE